MILSEVVAVIEARACQNEIRHAKFLQAIGHVVGQWPSAYAVRRPDFRSHGEGSETIAALSSDQIAH